MAGTWNETDAVARLRPLAGEFFARPTHEVARDLLGVWLCRRTDEGLTCGRIVETEAYGGPDDLASHARAGRTRRTTPMFGPVGHAYVYLIYGMHECLNVVAYDGAEGSAEGSAEAGPGSGAEAGAVLLRALEPTVGVELMRRRRGRAADPDARLGSGPARLCQAMAVDRSLDSHDLTRSGELWLAGGPDAHPSSEQSEGPRIGVDYARDGWATRPWRFWLAGHASVSRPPR